MLKLKARKFWDLIPTFVEVTGEKLVGGGFLVASILNRVKMQSISVFPDIAKFADLTVKELKWTIM